jgi:hypothetical protein
MARWACLYQRMRRLGESKPIRGFLSAVLRCETEYVHEQMGSTIRRDASQFMSDYLSVWQHRPEGDLRCSVKTLTPALERL